MGSMSAANNESALLVAAEAAIRCRAAGFDVVNVEMFDAGHSVGVMVKLPAGTKRHAFRLRVASPDYDGMVATFRDRTAIGTT